MKDYGLLVPKLGQCLFWGLEGVHRQSQMPDMRTGPDVACTQRLPKMADGYRTQPRPLDALFSAQ